MLVEDNADDLVHLRRLLTNAGIRNPVVAFISGEDALAYLKALKTASPASISPCVMFIDLKMPDVSGFELLKYARDQPEFQHLMIVVLTASDAPKDKDRAAELGADRYLVKYPLPEVLVQIVEAGCGRSAEPHR